MDLFLWSYSAPAHPLHCCKSDSPKCRLHHIILLLSVLHWLIQAVSQLRDQTQWDEVESMGDFSRKHFPALSK